MPFFRMRLILALVVGITFVSIGSTYFDVLAHKLAMRRELIRRTTWMGTILQPEMEQAVSTGDVSAITAVVQKHQRAGEMLGIAVYNPGARLIAAAGPNDVLQALTPGVIEKVGKRGAEVSVFGHHDDWQWLEDAIPLKSDNQMNGVMVLVVDARFIRAEGNAVWRRSFWRIAAFVVLIVGVTFLMVRWFLMRPMMRAAERLRLLRTGQSDDADESIEELSWIRPLAREVETMAESLVEARAAAQAEARLRDAGEHVWTEERLAVHMQERFGSSKIFLVSNREPYAHVRQGREVVCVVPPSGLVTALEPVLRACDGVWVAHGSGSEDRIMVDEYDRLRVPPGDPRYTLRRVWLTSEEESAYYDGFANEGLWPLCHIAHTRPIFRESDWEAYRQVNEKFATALLEEMEGCADPIVFVQDYHFALLPRLIKSARPDARVAIFWHIPWPNPESFSICPWQQEILDGLLGADLIGFHIPLHCSNFLASVDSVLEARTDREHMTALRLGHKTLVRPYPVSVVVEGAYKTGLGRTVSMGRSRPVGRQSLLEEFGINCDIVALGVDRLDYTKGIVERLLAIEQLLERHPYHLERLTMVQIAAPSRTRIPSYAELRRDVEKTAERINKRFQTAYWRPIVLIEEQCTHQQVDRWYRAADLCLVTSLHDGMNLVAKEYVAARSDEDGVLVLSKFTGAASELRDALLVNPYDIAAVAETVHAALEMSRSERRLRMQHMRRYLMDHNVYRWAANVLGDLHDLRLDGQGFGFTKPGPISVPTPTPLDRRSKPVEKARIG